MRTGAPVVEYMDGYLLMVSLKSSGEGLGGGGKLLRGGPQVIGLSDRQTGGRRSWLVRWKMWKTYIFLLWRKPGP